MLPQLTEQVFYNDKIIINDYFIIARFSLINVIVTVLSPRIVSSQTNLLCQVNWVEIDGQIRKQTTYKRMTSGATIVYK